MKRVVGSSEGCEIQRAKLSLSAAMTRRDEAYKKLVRALLDAWRAAPDEPEAWFTKDPEILDLLKAADRAAQTVKHETDVVFRKESRF